MAQFEFPSPGGSLRRESNAPPPPPWEAGWAGSTPTLGGLSVSGYQSSLWFSAEVGINQLIPAKGL